MYNSDIVSIIRMKVGMLTVHVRAHKLVLTLFGIIHKNGCLILVRQTKRMLQVLLLLRLLISLVRTVFNVLHRSCSTIHWLFSTFPYSELIVE